MVVSTIWSCILSLLNLALYLVLDLQMQELLLEYGVDTLAETIVEGFSRIRRCNNEGRALMSLDLQVCLLRSFNLLSVRDVVLTIEPGICVCVCVFLNLKFKI